MAAFPKAFLVFAIVAILATSQANALLVNNQLIQTLNLDGILFCSPTGANTGGSSVLSGVRVNVVVNGLVIASANTGPDGRIRISITNIPLLNGIVRITDIVLRIQLPISTCSIFSTVNGVLQGGVVGGLVNGGVLNVAPGLLSRVG